MQGHSYNTLGEEDSDNEAFIEPQLTSVKATDNEADRYNDEYDNDVG